VLAKFPVSKFLIASLMVNKVLAATVPPLGGNTNFDEGIWVLAGMAPIGAGLHEPPMACVPSVRGRLTVLQKLMKLLVDVNEAT